MKGADIVVGETYLFLATDSQERKSLEGTHFTVVEIKAVFRRFKRLGTRKVKRYFNDDGVGARASELEPLDGTPGNELPPAPLPLWEGSEDPF